MRLLVRMESKAHAEYNKSYHHKLRGRIWRGLKGTRFEELHGDTETPSFCFSNPFPWGDVREGDDMNVLISSPHIELLKQLEYDFSRNPEFNIGDMPFSVESVSTIDTDVGEPTSRGTIETGTGIYIPIHKNEAEEHGIEFPYNADTISWVPDMGIGIFNDKLEQVARWRYRNLYDADPDFSCFSRLFDSQNMIKTYSLEVPVTGDYQRTFILSKWKFDYTVQNNEHRDLLNTLLDVGVGWRNALGFGFVNVQGDNDEY